MEKLNAMFETFLEYMVQFAEWKAILALKDGFILTLPLTLAGSVFLLLANLPIGGYPEFMAAKFGADWADPLKQVSGATFDILAILSVLGISYKYAEAESCDAITCAMLSLASFLIITKTTATAATGALVTGIIPKQWVGGDGVITAIVVALAVSWIFCYFAKNNIGIKMPSGVPEGVARAFAALVPGLVIFALAAIVYFLCNKLFDGLTFTEIIFKGLQAPLQNLSDTLIGGVVLSFIMCILFWAGIHGPNIVSGVMNPILTANAMDNQKILDAGMALLGNEQAKIITVQVTDVFIKLGGCGLTIGLLIAMLLAARSAQLKQLSRLAVVPGLFNINEPIIFGLPIVFNPYFIVPFILTPIFAVLITYGSIAMGFMSPFNAVQVPWTTPPIISGFLLAGWQGIVVQLLITGMSAAVYFPFMKVQDKRFVEEEAAADQESSQSADLTV